LVYIVYHYGIKSFEEKYGVYNIAIHRGVLQQLLAEKIGYENIHLSKKLIHIEKVDNYKLIFEDGTSIESNIVIGADGIKSTIRNQLFKTGVIRNARQICWRGIAEVSLPETYKHEAHEIWAKGKRFGFVYINATTVYWFALINGSINKTDVSNINLKTVFSHFHADILHIITNTPKEKIIVNDIIDLKPIQNWQQQQVCLIGYAAHATTPNLGQGACQAVQDAYAIGKLLDKGVPITDCFTLYEKTRIKKAHTIVNKSWQIGNIAQLEKPVAIWLRNLVLKLTPVTFNKK
jgi:2-polyprenyl-6-methoxyphenol hydroxylase-like FAD-dependent oxidoreductase